MDAFLIKLNEETKEKFHYLKIKDVIIDKFKKSVDIDFFVPVKYYDELSKEENGKLLENASKKILNGYKVNLRFFKIGESIFDIKKTVLDFFETNYLFAFKSIKNEDVEVNESENGSKTVTIYLDSGFYSYIKNKNTDKELAKYLSDYFTDSFRIQIIEKKSNDLTLIANELNNFIPDLSEDNEIIITESQPVIGKKIISSPIRISSVEGVKQGIVFCGKVKLLTKREYKEKQGCFFTFVLDDYSASINVKYFPKTENSENAFDKMIKENSQVKCFGNIVMDKFTNKPAYMISNIELCVIDENSLKQIKKFAVEKKNYQYVFPKEYVEYSQQNLFVKEEKTDIPEDIKNKVFVVFDLETTGLYPTGNPHEENSEPDKIIEIGAVKIKDGKLTETFETFVNPKMHIPETATKVNNIKDDDVKDSPDIKKVLPDFYKFTRGASIIAHNASFDMSFIYEEAKKQNYHFDNEIIDTLTEAKKDKILSVYLSRFSLQSICAFYGIEQKNAHRALDDAICTAKVFINMKKNYIPDNFKDKV